MCVCVWWGGWVSRGRIYTRAQMALSGGAITYSSTVRSYEQGLQIIAAMSLMPEMQQVQVHLKLSAITYSHCRLK